jgi:hypothetical protein
MSTRTFVVADPGPVGDACIILATETTLADHVEVYGTSPINVDVKPDGIPFDLWGSGTQALWLLLCSIAYSADEVSLYRVLSRLDSRNTAAVARAFRALCGEVVSR